MSEQAHWLVRRATIRRLWQVGLFALFCSVLADAFHSPEGHFIVDGWFGFNAAYGFLSCLAMVLLAKFLGVFLKRRDGYYGD